MESSPHSIILAVCNKNTTVGMSEEFSKEVLIKTSDMSPEMECEAVNITNQAIEEVSPLTNVKDNEKMSKISALVKR